MATGLIRRSGRYSTRRVIPLDLQAHYGRREIVRALGTADPADARKLHAAMWVQLDKEFDQARAMAKVQKLGGASPFKSEQEQDEALGLSDLEDARAEVVNADPVLKAKARLAGVIRNEANERELLAELRTEATPGKVRQGTSLTAVADRWAAEQRPRPSFVKRARNIIDRFEDVVGELSVEAVTKQHVLTFKDELLAQGQTPANINVMIPILGIVFNYAADKLHLIQINPASKVRVTDKRRAKDKRREFDEAALKAIFGSPIYTDGARPAAGAGEAAYWLPLLALYTGARLTELGQLHPDDVLQETYRDADDNQHSAWVIRIVENAERGQQVKNEGSERRVPVHADLITLGFLKFVEQAKAEGRSRMFDRMNPNSKGELTGQWSKWFGRYRRKLGVTGRETPFHSFRHSFKHYARLASIPNDVHNEITGHETGDVANSYGGLSYPLAPLVDAMRRYRVPGFKLPAPPPGLS